MDVEDHFYDEITSFMPTAEDYSLDDLNEILRSTDSQLDAAIDFNAFMSHPIDSYPPPAIDDPANAMEEDDFSFSTFCAQLGTNQALHTSAYESQRSLSISSADFNPDDFLNFKIEEFTRDTVMEMKQRNTPSPTGSCTSSSGSSTSGVQSDASSVVSSAQTVELSKQSNNFGIESDHNTSVFDQSPIKAENVYTSPTPPNISFTSKVLPANNIVTASQSVTSVSVPVPIVPLLMSAQPATIVQPMPQKTPISIVSSTIVPVKSVPLTTMKPLTNMKAPVALKIQPRSGTEEPKAIPANIAPTEKVTPPANSKPKTIYLSSNDFKALIHKMNTSQRSTKISGGINGQFPKIFLKTPTGKVITTNKLAQPISTVNARLTANQNFQPKVMKTTAPLISKQLPPKIVASNINNIGTRSAFSTSRIPPRSVYKGVIDEKMYKKQQRMIKNRESASLSRKKKKEYMASLETRINNLEKENCTLKGENSSLRSQLVAFAQTCHCKNTNVSDFILNSLNISTKSSAGVGEHHHVRIAPKPPPKSIRPRITSASVKKNIAVLFAMAFMVTLNVGNFQTYFNKNAIENSIETTDESISTAGGRRLLWVETENEFNEKLNRTKRESEPEVPPLHFLRPLNRTQNPGVVNNTSQLKDDTLKKPPLPEKCANSNYSENLRLASNLHKWIDGNDYLNLSIHEKFGNIDKEASQFRLPSDYLSLKALNLPLQGQGTVREQEKRKFISEKPHYSSKHRRMNNNLDNDNNGNGNNDANIRNSLDFFKPKISDEYMRLFKGISRQDDTFYVLSFSTDHLLLPASAYNKSSRPKMSLILPAGDPSLNGDIVLMKIDCEVVNTTELELKSYMIPEKLRPIKYASPPHPNDVANNDTGHHTNIKSNANFSHRGGNNGDAKIKPILRTYSMMGPKNQAASTSKGKSTGGRLTANDSVIGGGVLKINNSTLFTKMRQTIGISGRQYDGHH